MVTAEGHRGNDEDGAMVERTVSDNRTLSRSRVPHCRVDLRAGPRKISGEGTSKGCTGITRPWSDAIVRRLIDGPANR